MTLDLMVPGQLTAALGPDLLLMGGAMILLLWSAWKPESETLQRQIGVASIILCLSTAVAIAYYVAQADSVGPGVIAMDNFRWSADIIFLVATIGTIALSIALLGTTIAAVFALPVSLLAARNIIPSNLLRFPVRLLRLVGTGGDTFPDYLGPVLAKGREEEVSRALAEAVLRLRGWDVLLLHDLDPSLAFVPAITEAARKARMQPLTGRSERIAYAELPATWDGWLGAMHRDKRYRIKNIRKKINAAHPTKFFVWKDAATLDQGIDRLIFLHNKRWEQAGQQHAFSTAEYRGFHRALMHALLAKDQLRLYCLELSGQIAAMYYFYKFRDAVYLMQSGFDPDFSDVKPGQVLLGYIFESAIGEGNKVLDFLRGDHRYKDELATGERETVFVTAFRARPGSLVYVMRRMLLPRLKAYVLAKLKKDEAAPKG